MLGKTAKIEVSMFMAVIVAAAVSAIRPHSFAVWMTEIFWVAGLLAVLLSTRRLFRFSLMAYGCFFVWMMLQAIGAHYTFELVPMDWLKEPLGLVRNPYDRIAHFTVGWFAFPFAELFLRKGWVKSAAFAAFFAVMTVVAMAGLWELVEWQYGRRRRGRGVPRLSGRHLGCAKGHPLRHPRRSLRGCDFCRKGCKKRTSEFLRF